MSDSGSNGRATISASRNSRTPSRSQSGPEISWRNKSLQSVSEDLLDAISDANVPPHLFQHQGQLVRVRKDADGAVFIEELTLDALRHHVDRAATFVVERTYGKQGSRVTQSPPPYDFVRDILAMPGWPKSVFPPVRRIVRCPFFNRVGNLVTTTGYDADSQIWYDAPSDLKVPEVPTRPTADDVARAKTLIIDELLGDFPFEEDADRANAVAIYLTLFCRDMIKGCVPMSVIDAPAPGTGKGLLLKCLAMPALGTVPNVSPQGESDAEWRKVITSVLVEAPQLVWFDNLRGTVISTALETVLTTTKWQDRELGSTKMLRMDVNCLFLATANNLQVGGDLSRRLVWVRLDARMENPEERTVDSFRHPDIESWVESNRSELVWAALVLIQNWTTRGKSPAMLQMGSFEHWCRTLGGVLDAAGIKGFLENAVERRRISDDNSAMWQAVCRKWWKDHGDDTIGVKELFISVMEDDLMPWLHVTTTEQGQRQKLGHALKRVRGRCFGCYRITTVGSDNSGRLRYKLELVSEPPEGGDDDESQDDGSPASDSEGGFEEDDEDFESTLVA